MSSQNLPVERRPFTPREIECIKALTDGSTQKEAAQKLGIGYQTLKNYRTTINRKLRIHSRAELMEYAVANGLAEGV